MFVRTMPRIALTSLALLATCLAIPQAAGAAWNQPVRGAYDFYGGVSGPDAGRSADMAVLDGTPYVAWSQWDGLSGANFEIHVARLNALGNGFVELGTGDSPVNFDSARDADHPSLAVVGGVLHVAWTEKDASGTGQIRVARFGPSGPDWVELVGGPRPVNRGAAQNAESPSLASIGGRPWVAWQENVGGHSHVYVSRLNADGSAWEPAPASALNNSSNADARGPSLTSAGGVPHVAWVEEDGTNSEVRVARNPGASGTAWEELGAPADNPVNHADNRDAESASIAAVGGVPHVAWHEWDGANSEVRVARLNAAGTDFEEIPGGGSPINHASDGNAVGKGNLVDIGGVPFVTWAEDDGTNPEVRVSRPNAAGTGWEEVVGGASPINQDPGREGRDPFLTQVGGVPYVAWDESTSYNHVVRMARLEPEFLASIDQVGDISARLTAAVNTYGVRLPVTFQYGIGTSLDKQTTPVIADSSNTTHDDVSVTVPGLAPFTTYSWRAAGTDLARITGAGPVRTFTTSDYVRPVIESARVEPSAFAVARNAAARRGATFAYRLSEAAGMTFTIQRKAAGRRVGRRCRKPTRRNAAARRCTRWVRVGSLTQAGAAGPNRRRFSGRIGRRPLRPSRYRAVLVARDPAGNRSAAKRLRFRIVRR